MLEGAVLCDRIAVQYLVAEGGFGLVYRAFHRTLNINVALKVLLPPPELSPAQLDEFVINFAMEAQTLERILHPNIVRVVDTGEAVMPSGHHTGFIALEWIDGVVLEDELESRRGQGGRTPAEAFALMRGVLEGLTAVHSQGVAHRDLKPGNIIVSATPQGPLVRLLDFGIAKWMRGDERAGSGRTRTFSNLQAYSPQYAAPEQLTGARTGPWTDVHAMALILSELLTDQPPLEGSSFPQLLASAMNPQRPTPARRQVDVGAWEPVLRKALSIRPDDRFHHAGEFLAALESALPGAIKRSLKEIDPDDPALARTLAGSSSPSNPAQRNPSGAPASSWVRAPQRPGSHHPATPSEHPVMLSPSLTPPEGPRGSTPLGGVPMHQGSTLPPPRRVEQPQPLAQPPLAPAPAPPQSSSLRGALVLIGGVVIGAAVALGAAASMGLLSGPRGPAVTVPPRRPIAAPRVSPTTRLDAATARDVPATDALTVNSAATDAAATDAAATDGGERSARRRHRHRRRHH